MRRRRSPGCCRRPGWWTTDAIGEGSQAGLAPGQVLVSRDGAVWRWDGYTIRAGTPTAAAVRLQQRNRLSLLQRDLGAARDEAATAHQARDAAAEADQAAMAAEQQARAGRAGAEQHLERARAAHQQLRAQAAEVAARLAAIDTRIEHLTVERDDADAALAHARDARNALPDLDALRGGGRGRSHRADSGPVGGCRGTGRTRNAGPRACGSHRAAIRDRGGTRRLGAACR